MSIVENQLFACSPKSHTPEICQQLNEIGSLFLAFTFFLTLLSVVVLNISHNRRRKELSRKDLLVEDEDSNADAPIW